MIDILKASISTTTSKKLVFLGAGTCSVFRVFTEDKVWGFTWNRQVQYPSSETFSCSNKKNYFVSNQQLPFFLSKSNSHLKVLFEQQNLEIYYIFKFFFVSANFISSFLRLLLIRVRTTVLSTCTSLSFKNFSIAERAEY